MALPDTFHCDHFHLHTASDLNLILTGEQEARHLGVNVRRVKLVVYIAASVLTGLAVSVSGAVGYVGLLVPHVMRMLFGNDYRMLIPTSAIGGAIAIVCPLMGLCLLKPPRNGVHDGRLGLYGWGGRVVFLVVLNRERAV